MKNLCPTSECWAGKDPVRDSRTRALADPRASLPPKARRRKIPDTLDSAGWQLGDRRILPLTSSGLRCSERGCVFPAQSQEKRKCAYHDRIEREPALFHSWQPTLLLLEKAKFGLPDCLPDESRARDRHLLSALREKFLSGGTS